MQRAAVGLAVVCAQLLGRVYGAQVTLLVGPGNNGGDALYAGAWLAGRGARVLAVPSTDVLHDGGRAALVAAGGRILECAAKGSALPAASEAAVLGADLVLDGLVGIGSQGALRENAATIVALLESCAGLVVSVDVPSGVDASTGVVAGAAVRADVTVTFGAWKPGLFLAPGSSYAGSLELVDVGLKLPPSAIQIADDAGVRLLLPAPTGDVNKYSRGVLGVAAGSDRYPGAAVLCVSGALAAGAGMVRYVGGNDVRTRVLDHYPEVVVAETVEAAHVQAWVVGSGLGADDVAAARTVASVLAAGTPCVVDADGLGAIKDRPDLLRDNVVLTPHAGELARLTGRSREWIEAHRLQAAREAAEQYGAVVLVKGSTTVIASPSGDVRINTTGTPWLSTAGTGDVLAGAIGSYLAQGLCALDAATAGAYLHGRCGQLASAGGVSLRSGTLATYWAAAERSVR